MKLTDKQVEALCELRRLGPTSPFHFGSTTVSRLRKLGLAEDVTREDSWGRTKHLRVTEAGLSALKDLGR